MTNGGSTTTAVGTPPQTIAGRRLGVRIAGSGLALPSKVLTNKHLESMMSTTDEWITQRTGIHTRRISDSGAGETTHVLSARALKAALADARIPQEELDLVILATMTSEMNCPSAACRVLDAAGITSAGAFDLNAACSGFVFGMNVAHDLIRGGGYRTVALIGADTLSKHIDYSESGRATAIIFGDAAGAVILRATDDAGLGILAQAMHSDGPGWKEIYVPNTPRDFPPGARQDPSKYGFVQMNGSAVFKFAVGTFPELIAKTLEKAGLKADQVDMYVCHQSNARILQAARDRFGIPEERFYINIDRFGNTVAASVPLCFHELKASGRIHEGSRVMFLAFGGGLTWGASLWQL